MGKELRTEHKLLRIKPSTANGLPMYTVRFLFSPAFFPSLPSARGEIRYRFRSRCLECSNGSEVFVQFGDHSIHCSPEAMLKQKYQ